MLEASRLRNKIIVQESKWSVDEIGGRTQTWSNLFTLWSEIKSTNGKERFFAGKLESNVSHKITIRFHSGIKAAHRLKYGDRIFQIKAVFHDEEKKQWTQLLCEEGVGS